MPGETGAQWGTRELGPQPRCPARVRRVQFYEILVISMEQPLHTIRAVHTSWLAPHRVVSLTASVAIVLGFAWALSIGLVATLVEKLPEVIKVEVLQEKLPEKVPPPPPPELKEPPPPFVPPPDFVIQTEAPATTAITAQSKMAAPPPISSPASIGRAHVCGRDYYPALSLRLGETGTTTLSFHITTDGSVRDIGVTNSSGSQRLDEAAVRCASTWHYRPAIQLGVPVEVPWQAKVVWNLENR
jgi:protein TonB